MDEIKIDTISFYLTLFVSFLAGIFDVLTCIFTQYFSSKSYVLPFNYEKSTLENIEHGSIVFTVIAIALLLVNISCIIILER